MQYAQFARFKHLTVEDGLTQNSITCLAQDKTGFIWIGTYNGLNKYDGYQITTFKASADDSSGIYHSAIRCLYPDDENNLWAGTIGGGMFRINLVSGKITNFKVDSLKANSISNNFVNAIREFLPGKLYISTNDGLNIFDKKTELFTVIHKTGKNSIPFLSDNIRQMTKDTRGHIWFTHLNAGITEYNPENGACNYYSKNAGDKQINSNSVKTIYADSKGRIWISCWNMGSAIVDTKTGKIFSSNDTLHKYKDLSKVALISQFYEDNKGNIWMATAEHGIACMDAVSNKIIFYENDKGDGETINDNTVFAIFQDRSGLIWAGTWKGGVNIMNPRTLLFGYYKHQSHSSNTLGDNNVTAIARKSDHEVFIGHSAAVDLFDYKDKHFKPFPINVNDNQSLRANSSVLFIYSDSKDSSLWFSTSGGYPYRYYPKTGKYRNYIATADTSSFGYHTTFTILRDNSSQLWIASSAEGLYLYNDAKDNFKVYKSQVSNAHTISGNSINTFIQDRDGNLLIGTNKGLCLFNTGTKIAERFIKDDAGINLFGEEAVYALHLDKKNNLWVGTTGGLYWFDTKTKTQKKLSKLNEAFSNMIYGIVEDQEGNLWITTDNGILMLNDAQKIFRHYNTADGLQGREFALNSCFRSDDGILFFGGSNGLNVFDPKKLETNNSAPQIAFTGFSVLNKNYPLPVNINYIKEINLTYHDYFFSFEFSALDYTNIAENRYEYKLEGFNDTWVNNGNSHSVTFTNLNPGNYTLKVRACNNDGVWCKIPAEVKISISPPFWKTTWFYAICGMLGILCFYLYIQWREKRLVKEKILLENEVEKRTIELKEEKLKLEVAHKEIKDSINYAKRIQEAILPLKENIDNYLQEYFILYKPKDIVAGDFYWFYALPEEEAVLIAAVDCTGHGVPGAFMSMIGNEQLSKIINERNITQPDLILNELHKGIRAALKQDHLSGETRDGMDIVLCKLFLGKSYLEYAGAMRPLWLIRNHELTEIKANKQPIGGMEADYRKPFTNNRLEIKKNDCIYLFTDGFADQFGGERGKKFMLRNFEKMLIEIDSLSMTEKQTEMNKQIEKWKGNHEQVDDILVIGIKF